MEKLKDIAPLYFQEENSSIFMMDCVSAMKNYPDNYFDLAVVDPPYGLNINSSGSHFKKRHDIKNWDKEGPGDDYFTHLFRVSKNQIIWGGNYFTEKLSQNNNWIIWDKKNPNLSFSEAELAWCSIKKNIRIFAFYSVQVEDCGKIHPTQKPIALYNWIFKNYAETGMKVLDTHLGSGSSRIAAHKAGMDFTGFEIDEDYFRASNKRFKDYHSQLTLFSHVS
jgi:site-specific DNA-methyltransferase (adenine-specific)